MPCIIRVKDPEQIVQLAKKYRKFQMELTIYLNDPQAVGGLKSRRRVDIIKKTKKGNILLVNSPVYFLILAIVKPAEMPIPTANIRS
jgi:hypothetical protein